MFFYALIIYIYIYSNTSYVENINMYIFMDAIVTLKYIWNSRSFTLSAIRAQSYRLKDVCRVLRQMYMYIYIYIYAIENDSIRVNVSLVGFEVSTPRRFHSHSKNSSKELTHREIVSKTYWINQESDCVLSFPDWFGT